MMAENKPIWIICTNEWATELRKHIDFSNNGCPIPFKGASCPRREDGTVMRCDECWMQYVDFDIIDKEEGEEE